MPPPQAGAPPAADSYQSVLFCLTTTCKLLALCSLLLATPDASSLDPLPAAHVAPSSSPGLVLSVWLFLLTILTALSISHKQPSWTPQCWADCALVAQSILPIVGQVLQAHAGTMPGTNAQTAAAGISWTWFATIVLLEGALLLNLPPGHSLVQAMLQLPIIISLDVASTCSPTLTSASVSAHPDAAVCTAGDLARHVLLRGLPLMAVSAATLLMVGALHAAPQDPGGPPAPGSPGSTQTRASMGGQDASAPAEAEGNAAQCPGQAGRLTPSPSSKAQDLEAPPKSDSLMPLESIGIVLPRWVGALVARYEALLAFLTGSLAAAAIMRALCLALCMYFVSRVTLSCWGFKAADLSKMSHEEWLVCMAAWFTLGRDSRQGGAIPGLGVQHLLLQLQAAQTLLADVLPAHAVTKLMARTMEEAVSPREGNETGAFATAAQHAGGDGGDQVWEWCESLDYAREEEEEEEEEGAGDHTHADQPAGQSSPPSGNPSLHRHSLQGQPTRFQSASSLHHQSSEQSGPASRGHNGTSVPMTTVQFLPIIGDGVYAQQKRREGASRRLDFQGRAADAHHQERQGACLNLKSNLSPACAHVACAIPGTSRPRSGMRGGYLRASGSGRDDSASGQAHGDYCPSCRPSAAGADPGDALSGLLDDAFQNQAIMAHLLSTELLSLADVSDDEFEEGVREAGAAAGAVHRNGHEGQPRVSAQRSQLLKHEVTSWLQEDSDEEEGQQAVRDLPLSLRSRCDDVRRIGSPAEPPRHASGAHGRSVSSNRCSPPLARSHDVTNAGRTGPCAFHHPAPLAPSTRSHPGPLDRSTAPAEAQRGHGRRASSVPDNLPPAGAVVPLVLALSGTGPGASHTAGTATQLCRDNRSSADRHSRPSPSTLRNSSGCAKSSSGCSPLRQASSASALGPRRDGYPRGSASSPLGHARYQRMSFSSAAAADSHSVGPHGPGGHAHPLMTGPASIVVAASHPCVTLFFSDIVGFSTWAHKLPPEVVMGTLNDLYSRLDDIILNEMPSLYKVETIGDAYVMAGNLLTPDPDHAATVMRFALRAQEEVSKVKRPDLDDGTPLQMRIGLHSGPIMSGIVGKIRQRFCLYGNTMNMAARTEATCPPGCIQVTASTQGLAAHCMPPHVSLLDRGAVQVKGSEKPIRMYLLF